MCVVFEIYAITLLLCCDVACFCFTLHVTMSNLKKIASNMVLIFSVSYRVFIINESRFDVFFISLHLFIVAYFYFSLVTSVKYSITSIIAKQAQKEI